MPVVFLHFQNNTLDSSGNGSNGTVTGTRTFVAGFVGLGFSFNGSTNMKIANPSLYDFDISNPFSLAYYASIGTIGVQYGILDCVTSGKGFQVIDTSNSHQLTLAGSGGNIVVKSTSTFTGGHVYAWTYDGSGVAAGVKLYVDGVSKSLTVVTDALSGTMAGGANIILGSFAGGSGKMTGVLDEVIVTSGVFSSTDITNINNGTYGGPQGNAAPTETLTLSDTIQVLIIPSRTDTLSLSDTIKVSINSSPLDTLLLSDSIKIFVKTGITDSITLVDALKALTKPNMQDVLTLIDRINAVTRTVENDTLPLFDVITVEIIIPNQNDVLSLSDLITSNIMVGFHQLITAQTQKPMPQDPALSLKYLLQTSPLTDPIGQWGSLGSNPNLPVAAAVNVDTKWGPSNVHNRILIENMPRLTEYQMLGGARIRTTDVKRVQVWCDTDKAVQNKWLIEEEIRRLIMSNKLNFNAVGIDEVLLMQGFQDIDVSGRDASGESVSRGGFLARSSCLVKMIYDEISQ